MKKYIAPAILTALMSMQAKADCTAGLTAYTAGNYEKAFSLLKSDADQGIACAQMWIAELYKSGKGVGKDINQARRYYQLAAKQGNNEALVQLEMLNTL